MGFFPERGTIWLDGELLPWSDARVHVCVHGLHYGSGVFEGIRFYDTARGPGAFRLGEHLRRFDRSAAQYRMRLGWSEEQLARAVWDVIEASELPEGYIRPLAFYGYGNLGILPKQCPVNVAIIVYPFPLYLGAEGIQNGIRVTVSPWRKTHTSSVPSTAKGCGQYLNSLLSLSDARARGFEEALLLNQEGFVAEGSGENLFYVKDGTLVTNDAPASILPGITQASVLELARLHAIPSRIQTWIPLDDVLGADEAFLTGTAAEVTPIREVDDRPIGEGQVGPLTRRLQDSFFATARGEAHGGLGWLTFNGPHGNSPDAVPVSEDGHRDGADVAVGASTPVGRGVSGGR